MFKSFVKSGSEMFRKEAQPATGHAGTDSAEQPLSAEQVLHNRIIALWKEVWLGLYQIPSQRSTRHLDRLKEHYLAAGMSAPRDDEADDETSLRQDHAVLGLLSVALSQQSVRGLRVFDGLSVALLEKIVALLEVYKSHLPSIAELYTVLKRLEVGFRMPTEDDERVVREEFVPLADALARHLLHLDARLAVLLSDLYDESWAAHGNTSEGIGWTVYEKVYPRQRAGFSSIKSRS